MTTTNINIRLEKELKQQAENLFSELGMNMTTAFNIFLRQSVRQGKIPFEISLNTPNAVTLAAIQEAEEIRCGKKPGKTESVKDFFEREARETAD